MRPSQGGMFTNRPASLFPIIFHHVPLFPETQGEAPLKNWQSSCFLNSHVSTNSLFERSPRRQSAISVHRLWLVWCGKAQYVKVGHTLCNLEILNLDITDILWNGNWRFVVDWMFWTFACSRCDRPTLGSVLFSISMASLLVASTLACSINLFTTLIADHPWPMLPPVGLYGRH